MPAANLVGVQQVVAPILTGYRLAADDQRFEGDRETEGAPQRKDDSELGEARRTDLPRPPWRAIEHARRSDPRDRDRQQEQPDVPFGERDSERRLGDDSNRGGGRADQR